MELFFQTIAFLKTCVPNWKTLEDWAAFLVDVGTFSHEQFLNKVREERACIPEKHKIIHIVQKSESLKSIQNV